MAGLNATQIANFNKAYQAFNAMAVIQKAQSELWNILDQDVQAFDVNADAPWKTKGIDHVIANFYNLVKNGVGPTFQPYAYGQPDFSKQDKAKGYRIRIMVLFG